MGKVMTKRALTREFDRGMIIGIALACSIMQASYDRPSEIRDVLDAAALNRRKMKSAGVDPYDLAVLEPVFREMREDAQWAKREKSRRALEPSRTREEG